MALKLMMVSSVVLGALYLTVISFFLHSEHPSSVSLVTVSLLTGSLPQRTLRLPASAFLRREAEGGLRGDRWIVITTINYPTATVRKLAELDSWRLVVVGDVKTPADWTARWHHPRCTFLDVAAQNALGYRTASRVPYNHYARKNIGYLFAIQHGARIIYETDDDNEPLYARLHPLPPSAHNLQVFTAAENRTVVNPYAFFGQPTLWPRGYPLESVAEVPQLQLHRAENNTRPWIQQGLANGDPDVDAILRLTRKDKGKKIDIRFDEEAPPIALPPGLFSPFNSQTTFFHYPAFWGLMIPVGVTFRVSDIWRGYWAQRLLWDVGGCLAFLPPTVHQDRNEHDYFADFVDEAQLYRDGGRLVKFLKGWRSDETHLFRRIHGLSVDMAVEGFWEWEAVDLVEAWLYDMTALGFESPRVELFRRTSQSDSLLLGRGAVYEPKELRTTMLRYGSQVGMIPFDEGHVLGGKGESDNGLSDEEGQGRGLSEKGQGKGGNDVGMSGTGQAYGGEGEIDGGVSQKGQGEVYGRKGEIDSQLSARKGGIDIGVFGDGQVSERKGEIDIGMSGIGQISAGKEGIDIDASGRGQVSARIGETGSDVFGKGQVSAGKGEIDIDAPKKGQTKGEIDIDALEKGQTTGERGGRHLLVLDCWEKLSNAVIAMRQIFETAERDDITLVEPFVYAAKIGWVPGSGKPMHNLSFYFDISTLRRFHPGLESYDEFARDRHRTIGNVTTFVHLDMLIFFDYYPVDGGPCETSTMPKGVQPLDDGRFALGELLFDNVTCLHPNVSLASALGDAFRRLDGNKQDRAVALFEYHKVRPNWNYTNKFNAKSVFKEFVPSGAISAEVQEFKTRRRMNVGGYVALHFRAGNYFRRGMKMSEEERELSMYACAGRLIDAVKGSMRSGNFSRIYFASDVFGGFAPEDIGKKHVERHLMAYERVAKFFRDNFTDALVTSAEVLELPSAGRDPIGVATLADVIICSEAKGFLMRSKSAYGRWMNALYYGIQKQNAIQVPCDDVF